MATFAYRVLPPPEFSDGLGPGEVALMVRHLDRPQGLREDGPVRLVGCPANGDHGFVLSEARDRASADAIARSDPAVVEGLLRLKPHTVLVALDAAGSQKMAPMVRSS